MKARIVNPPTFGTKARGLRGLRLSARRRMVSLDAHFQEHRLADVVSYLCSSRS